MSQQEDLSILWLLFAFIVAGIMSNRLAVFLGETTDLHSQVDDQASALPEQRLESVVSPAPQIPASIDEHDEPLQQKLYTETEGLSESIENEAFSPDERTLSESHAESAVELQENIPEVDPSYDEVQSKLRQPAQQFPQTQRDQQSSVNPFAEAINTATEAANLVQTAQSIAEWKVVADKWQEAIYQMKAVPQDSPDYLAAIDRIPLYEINLRYARSNALEPSSMPSVISTLPVYAPARMSQRGRCDCPYDRDSRGNLCGGRSAYSRPGGRSPLCYVITE